MKSILTASFLVALMLTTFVHGQEQSQQYPKRTYTTQSIENASAPAIDGVMDDEVWNLVDWTSDYVEFQPDNGTPPTEQTKMKIVYDSKNLYIGFKCYQEDPSTIERRMGRRDDFPGDWVEINIDSYNDDRTAFSFTVSASGVKGDEFVSNNGNFDDSWNPIWYVDTKIDDDGWTAEMRIPLSQLRFGNAEEQAFNRPGAILIMKSVHCGNPFLQIHRAG